MPRRRSTDAITSTEPIAHASRRGQRPGLASRAIAMAAIVLGSIATLSAHDPGLSALDVRVGETQIVAVLSLAAADADIARRESVDFMKDAVELLLDGHSIGPETASSYSDATGSLHVRLEYARATGTRLAIRPRLLAHLARGHRQLVSIRTAGGVLLAERMLDLESDDASADISAIVPAGDSSFTRFFALGVAHILTGYDHLLFLAGVLVVLQRWRDVVQTITAFTLAHSLTLALATTGVALVPSRVVEPLIAASIVYVGIENLFRPVQGSRWMLTFCFGLVHGLGFATALRDLGVGSGGHGAIAVPLAAFNGGVEAGQIAVAGLLVPLFWWLGARRAKGLSFGVAWSLLVVLTGSYWLVERIG